MAEAFPENFPDNQEDEDLHSQQKPISILMLAVKWQFDTYGLSTVNKSLVNNLRMVDPEHPAGRSLISATTGMSINSVIGTMNGRML